MPSCSQRAINCYTGDRHEVLGPKGSVRKPGGLGKAYHATGVSCDPGAIQVPISIPPGKSMTILFGLGYSDDENEINSLILKYKDTETAEKELSAVSALGRHPGRLEGGNLGPGDGHPHQRMAPRTSHGMSARTAFYQCGGHMGSGTNSRMPWHLYTRPDILREQIIRSSKGSLRRRCTALVAPSRRHRGQDG